MMGVSVKEGQGMELYLVLFASLSFYVASTTAKSSIEILDGEAGSNCHQVLRTPSSLERDTKEVGKVCAEIVEDGGLVNIDVFIHSNEEEHCYFNHLNFANLPLSSENGLISESYSFQIPVGDLKKNVCVSSETDNTSIIGEGLHTCVTTELYDQENVRNYFSIPIKCNEEIQAEEEILSEDNFDSGSDSYAEENTFENVVDVDSPAITTIESIRTRNYLVHTPKTGGTSVEHRLRSLFDEVLGDDEGKRRVCRVKDKLFDSSGVRWDTEAKETGCVIATGEQRYHPTIPDRSYAILRNPQDHVLSQYFHCTESPPGRHKNQHILDRGDALPSLDEWLNMWIAVKENKMTPNEAMNDFHCYDPTNLQAYYLSNGAAAYPKSDPELRERYETIGLTQQTVKSSCILFIKLTGIVPSSCNCAEDATQGDGQFLPATRRLRSKKQRPTRRLDEIRIDHGVTHHGDTFRPTEEQKKKIEMLTDIDRLLYDFAMDIFDDQVSDVEKQYGIRLCEE